jgi:hypothetical protein
MKSKRLGKRWISALIQNLWEVAWDLWDYRNSILHHQENCVYIEKERQSKRAVINLFKKLLTTHLRSRDRHLLKLPLGDLLKKDYLYRSQWSHQAVTALRSITKGMRLRKTKETRLIRGMQSVMRRWVSRSAPT